MRMLTPLLIVGLLAGCAPDPSTPTSPLQWERRQQAIERREAERKAYCAQPARAADPSCTARPGVQP
jgi:type IV pilus biogenesis protein CpaD/CtpE